MKKIKAMGFFLSCVAVMAAFALSAVIDSARTAHGAGSLNTIIFRMSDSTAALGSTTGSTLLLATSTSRSYAVFTNLSTTSQVYLSLGGGTPARRFEGVTIAPQGTYEIRDANLYTGAVYFTSFPNAATTTVAASQ